MGWKFNDNYVISADFNKYFVEQAISLYYLVRYLSIRIKVHLNENSSVSIVRSVSRALRLA